MMYSIVSDYCSEEGHEEQNLTEIYEGSWTGLQDHIKGMKKQGFYNISAEALDNK